jgi:ATP-binding cassette, subfamily B, multidrug efflux pump
MFRFFEAGIDPFRDHDQSMPPASLVGYYGRYCRQVWPFLAALMAIGLVIALIEVAILRFVGAIVDILRLTPPDKLFEAHGLQFLAMALLILIGRPMATFTHDLVVQQAIAPGMTNLIRWQTHRYVLRQSVSYFATTSPAASPPTSSRPRRHCATPWCRSSTRCGSSRSSR